MRLVKITAEVGDAGEGLFFLADQLKALLEPVDLIDQLGRKPGMPVKKFLKIAACHIVRRRNAVDVIFFQAPVDR